MTSNKISEHTINILQYLCVMHKHKIQDLNNKYQTISDKLNSAVFSKSADINITKLTDELFEIRSSKSKCIEELKNNIQILRQCTDIPEIWYSQFDF